VEARILTQEELLEEAKETEKKNLELLEEMLKLELKQKPVIRKQKVFVLTSKDTPGFLLMNSLRLSTGSLGRPSPFCPIIRETFSLSLKLSFLLYLTKSPRHVRQIH